MKRLTFASAIVLALAGCSSTPNLKASLCAAQQQINASDPNLGAQLGGAAGGLGSGALGGPAVGTMGGSGGAALGALVQADLNGRCPVGMVPVAATPVRK